MKKNPLLDGLERQAYLDGLGVERKDDSCDFRDPLENVTRGPELVAGGDADGGTYLELPLPQPPSSQSTGQKATPTC